MSRITVLDQHTINKIAAGEVIERPASVVKELVENAIDAGANAVTVEIKDGGCSLIRITDNGGGIPKDEVQIAFLRHSTSKIKKVEDLLCITSLGFRGEALSSIAAVSQVELITKTPEALTGTRYLIDGGKEKSIEEIGAPEGTTFIVRNLFYNTPARRKFLKSATSEANSISDLIERLALSRPDISFRFINNNQNKLYTSGNGNLKDVIYTVYGRDIAANILPVNYDGELFHIDGFIGKPVLSRATRQMENYYINGRYIKSSIITKAVEDACEGFAMPRKYPFTSLHLTIASDTIDINVHPSKMEIRFSDGETVYREVRWAVYDALSHKEVISEVKMSKEQEKAPKVKLPPQTSYSSQTSNTPCVSNSTQTLNSPQILNSPQTSNPQKEDAPQQEMSSQMSSHQPKFPEPFETGRMREENRIKEYRREELKREEQGQQQSALALREASEKYSKTTAETYPKMPQTTVPATSPENRQKEVSGAASVTEGKVFEAADNPEYGKMAEMSSPAVQMTIFDNDRKLLDEKNLAEHRIIGQLFDTYWLVEFDGKLFIIDQHAAHEKVLYERYMKRANEGAAACQQLMPPQIITLTLAARQVLKDNIELLNKMGFEIESFGGNEYAIRGVPVELYGASGRDMVMEVIDGLMENSVKLSEETIKSRIATMACKAAVKGNHRLKEAEVRELIRELVGLDNPYNCPHGRPTMISISKYELERKFKRIV